MAVVKSALVNITNSHSVSIIETKTIVIETLTTGTAGDLEVNAEIRNDDGSKSITQRKINKLYSVVVLSSWLL